MAFSKAFLALVAVPLARSTPRCATDGTEFQDWAVIYRCEGSGGDMETNLIKAEAAPNTDTVMARLPALLPNFKAILRTDTNADLFIRDPDTQRSIYEDMQIQEGTSGEGDYEGMHVVVMANPGLPTVELVKTTGTIPRVLELVVRNKGPKMAKLSIGYHYDAWSAGGTPCPWKQLTLGCEKYTQATVLPAALTYSKWLLDNHRSCGEAWQKMGVPQTRNGPSVPYYKWPLIFQQWPKQERPVLTGTLGVEHLSWAMYKLASGGGLEAGKEEVTMQDFLWTCRAYNMESQFVQPCCTKLRTAFVDQNDAWQKLGLIAQANAHRSPQNGLWEVCRTLPNAPVGGRDALFRFFSPGAEMTANDLAYCYPNGPVIVAPTVKPLIEVASAETAESEVSTSWIPTHRTSMPPWELDSNVGTGLGIPTGAVGGTPEPSHEGKDSSGSSGTTGTYGPTLKPKPGQSTKTFDIDEISTSASPGSIDGTTPSIDETTPKAHGGVTGTTMDPNASPENGPSTSPVKWHGALAAGLVGTAVAGAIAGAAVGIKHAVDKGNKVVTGATVANQDAAQQSALATQMGYSSNGGAPVMARREAMADGASTDATGKSQQAQPGAIAHGVPLLLLLGAVCCCLCCIGAAGAMIYAMRKKKSREAFDRAGPGFDMEGHGYYGPPYAEDQAALLSHSSERQACDEGLDACA